jgi:Glycerol kinase
LIEKGYKDQIHEKTGLIVDAYFSATKIRWILDQVPGAQERAEKGELLFGTIDTWLVWKLTGGKQHVLIIQMPVVRCCSTLTIWTGMTIF